MNELERQTEREEKLAENDGLMAFLGFLIGFFILNPMTYICIFFIFLHLQRGP